MAISSCSFSWEMAEETGPHLTTSSFQATVEQQWGPVPNLLFFPQQPQFLSCLSEDMFSTLHQLHFPSLEHPPASQCPSWSEGPRMEHSNQDLTRKGLTTERQLLPQSSWPHDSHGLLPQIHSTTWFCSWHRKVHTMDLVTALQTVLITYGLFGKGIKIYYILVL